MSCLKLSLRWQANTWTVSRSEPLRDGPDQMSPIEFGNYCRLKRRETRPHDCHRRLFMGLSIDFLLLRVKLGWKISIWLSDIFTGHGPQSHSISSWHFISLLSTAKDNPQQSKERSVLSILQTKLPRLYHSRKYVCLSPARHLVHRPDPQIWPVLPINYSQSLFYTRPKFIPQMKFSPELSF